MTLKMKVKMRKCQNALNSLIQHFQNNQIREEKERTLTLTIKGGILNKSSYFTNSKYLKKRQKNMDSWSIIEEKNASHNQIKTGQNQI